ncbi:hypothetical protein NLI96_g8570 [Meripilus lineatus]|uniref:Glycoside hydrolase family 76 protein n=1 Tax=Meripilus lineatus TaxID=2056292 RepID=A0AAD5V297_9APHY|nr:hypothetical protein NLI96_g8570 [Physisporinus lineatus]
MYGYHAYKDQQLLQFAATNWNTASRYFISPQNAASGSQPERNVTFRSQCNNATIAGGIFWQVDVQNDSQVDGETVALTAYLYEATQESTYSDTAALTAAFIATQLHNETVVIDGINLVTCNLNRLTVTASSGYFIEGLAVYSQVTNSTYWTSLLQQLVATAIKSPLWTGGNGVNTAAAQNISADTNNINHSTKGILIRGLYVAWKRADATSEMAKLIKAYITYYALLNAATVPGVYHFSPAWNGPPARQLLPWGQIAAMDVLNAALGFALQAAPNKPIVTGTTTTSREPTSPVPGQERKQQNLPLIVGLASLAGVLICLSLTIIIIRTLRRQGRGSQNSRGTSESRDAIDHSPIPGLDPYTITDPRQKPRERSKFVTSPGRSVDRAEQEGPPSGATRTRDGADNRKHSNQVVQQRTRIDRRSEDAIDDIPAMMPILLEKLNRVIAMLPPGGISTGSEAEDPPEYMST